ncbi:MAG: NACHT domain-containing protein, partial [Candidatus Methylumidiphilus sp.]
MTNGNEIFNWPRYWYPNDQNDFYIFSQFGYLNLPTKELYPYYSFVPSKLSDLSDIPVLILLGDPGTGKSQSLADEQNRLGTNNNNEIIYCDLKEYGNGDQQELAELLNQEKLSELKEGIKLWLLIDGLDECGLPDPSNWLIRNFINKITTLDRVYVRIACRVSSWPEKLEEALHRQWQSKDDSLVKKLRLCPLREEDLRIAAQTMGLDANGFLQVVAQGDAQQLAALPVTANFMLNLYSKGQLPSQRTDIFEKGLRSICEDSPARRNTKLKGQVCSDKRFIVAARLSLGYILLGSNGIWNGPEFECPSNLFLTRDIYG